MKNKKTGEEYELYPPAFGKLKILPEIRHGDIGAVAVSSGKFTRLFAGTQGDGVFLAFLGNLIFRGDFETADQ